ncbi:cysteine desulfurase family protein [Sanguibacter antarcticus]|uniref:cysteine desulfurase family protein n=1 Tax=Sanguibacter antarcticus TaxID=372484 RepID=UPI000BF63698|nr:aminotransferase class V-fold PLP-dependent enzyme [Sanguibacter antarcticus]
MSADPVLPSHRVHLDAGGNARLHPLARQAFLQAVDDGWSDPRRLYSESRRAATLLAGAREALAASLGARTGEIHLAPSHTVALHSAVAATVHGRRRTGSTVVVSAVERAVVLSAAGHAAASTDLVPVDRLGQVDVDRFTDAVAGPGIALAALQHSNGEVGTIQPVGQALDAARAAKVPLLVDAGAAVGHVAMDDSWDLLAADPADWGGPSGVGVLAVRQQVRWSPTWPDDPDRWFPGGVSVPAAFAAAVALQARDDERAATSARHRRLVDRLRTRIPQLVPDVEIVGPDVDRLPHVMTFSCLFVDGEALVTELDKAGFTVGSGSACASAATEPSHVLAAMGVLTHGNARIVLDDTTSDDDIERFLAALPVVVAHVRSNLGVDGL